MRRGGAEIGAAVTAGRQHHHLGVEDVDRAVVELPAHHAGAAAIGDDQVEREVLDEELGLFLEALAIQRVQDRVAGTVGGGAGALHGRALAELGRVAAERALIDLALFGARERHAVMFQLIDRGGRRAREVFHRVGVAQPVRALHGVVHVPLPVVGAHVGQRRGDAALRRDGVRPGREHLGDAGGLEALFSHAQRGAQPRPAGAHDHHVIVMRLVLICGHGTDLSG